MANCPASDDRRRLTVAMVVRDAAATLEMTLDSVRAIADEILVVDTGSSDGTLAMARNRADVVEQIEWQDSYAAARNECLRQASGDWILCVEPGETIDDSAAQQLRNFINDSAEDNKAYMLFVQRPAAGSAICADQIGQLRLVPNRPELRFTGRVREQILPSVIRAKMGVDAIDCPLRREHAAEDPEHQRLLARRMLNLANLALTEEGDRSTYLLARAEALSQLGRAKEAASAYRRAIEVADRGSSEMLEAYYGLLTTLDAEPAAASDEQIATCLAALQVYPLDSQLLCGMGGYLLRAQRLDLAARSYEVAVMHGKVDPAVWHLVDLADVAVSCWSLVLQLMRDTRRAEDVLRTALAERPESLRLRRQLIGLYVKTGREREALAQCRHLPDDLPWKAEMPTVIRGAVLAAAKKSASALGPLQRAYQAGCRDPLCLRWLAAAHLELGNLADVELVSIEWARLEPGNLEFATFLQAAAGRSDGGLPAVVPRRVDSAAPGTLPLSRPASTPNSTAMQSSDGTCDGPSRRSAPARRQFAPGDS
jgi:predicted Zn-dependent protease